MSLGQGCVFVGGPTMLELPTETYTAFARRLDDELGGNWITDKMVRALLYIAQCVLRGDDQPTVARIAIYARCSPSTVRRARAIAETRGLMVVKPQYDPAARQQRANEYAVRLPTEPVTPKPKPARAPKRPPGSQTDCPNRLSLSKATVKEGSKGSVRALTDRENAARQLRMLGYPLPAHW